MKSVTESILPRDSVKLHGSAVTEMDVDDACGPRTTVSTAPDEVVKQSTRAAIHKPDEGDTVLRGKVRYNIEAGCGGREHEGVDVRGEGNPPRTLPYQLY